MVAATMVAGAVAEVVGWRLVVARRLSVWVAMGSTFGALGVAAVLVRRPPLSPAVSPAVAALAGGGAGLALYLATRVVVRVLRGWETFQRHGAEIYGKGHHRSLGVSLLLAVGVVAVGEELFWRGLFQARLAQAAGRGGGAALAWVAYVFANVPSANLAILTGAVVGGAAWTAFALWTRGVLASVVCHGVWTGLMLAFPVVRRPAVEEAP